MGAFVITKRFSDEYKFEFTSRKGKTIYTSKGYELRFECENEIEFIKQNLEESTYLKFKSSGGKYFFKLIINEQVLATSRKYNTELRLQKGINEIIKYSAKAEILDFSNSDFVFPDL